MAAVATTRPIHVAPPGYELPDFGYASADISAGDPIIITGTVPSSSRWDKTIAKATTTEAHGIAAKDVLTGGTCEILYQSEMDGFAGLTPGAPLSIVSGKIDNTAPTTTDAGSPPGVSPVAAQIRALTATRIRFSFV